MKSALFSVAIVACISTAAFGISFDLDDGSFVTLPAVGLQATDYTGVYQSPTFDASDIDIAPGTSATITFDFVDSPSNNAQFITLTDALVTSLPNEGVIFDVAGTGTSLLNPTITLVNATGSYRGFVDPPTNVANADVTGYIGTGEAFSGTIRIGEFSGDFPNDPALLAGFSRDVTNASLSFTGLKLELFNAGTETIHLSDVSFQAIANGVQIETVPEPLSVAVWATLGTLAIGWAHRRRRRALSAS